MAIFDFLNSQKKKIKEWQKTIQIINGLEKYFQEKSAGSSSGVSSFSSFTAATSVTLFIINKKFFKLKAT